MIYKIKKGTIYHTKILIYINLIDKWNYVLNNINEILDYEANTKEDGGIYSYLNELNSIKVNINNVPQEKKKYYDKNGWLLPNNKYYTRWIEFVERLDLKSFDKDYLQQFKLNIFKKPILNLDLEELDLYIKTEGLKKMSNNNKSEYLILEEYYELTNLTQFPNVN